MAGGDYPTHFNKFTPELRQKLFAGLTGRPDADVSGTGSNFLGMLRAAFPSGRAKYGVDTKAAAAALGVSVRTAERYLAPAGRQRIKGPTGERLKRLQTASRQAATPRKGRAAAVAPTRTAGGVRRGTARLTITGVQYPMGDPEYARWRAVTLSQDTFNPDHAQAFFDAYEQGGDKAVLGWLARHMSNEYAEGWQFDTVDSFTLEP